jgi:hypothetical protein
MYTSATTITFKNITKGAKHMATTPFVLDEGFSLTVSAAGVDSKGTPRPLDPGVALTWGADKTGILQISPVSGTFTAQFSAVPGGPGGLVTITCTGNPLGKTNTITGTCTIQVNPSVATSIVLTATPEVALP